MDGFERDGYRDGRKLLVPQYTVWSACHRPLRPMTPAERADYDRGYAAGRRAITAREYARLQGE